MPSAPGGPLPAISTTQEVLSYFVRNPQAADSLEGVARWRVQQETVHRTVEQVGQALGWLVQQGLLVRETPAGVPPIFRLNRKRADDAKRLLDDLARRSPLVDIDWGRPERRIAEQDPDVDATLMNRVLSWIDATLLRFHLQSPADGDALPGLTRSRSSIEDALTRRSRGPTGDVDEARHVEEEALRELEKAVAQADSADPLSILHRRLALSGIEFRALLLCLAPELDAKYQAIYGVLSDDLGRRTATLGMICALLGEPVDTRRVLGSTSGLTRWRLLDRGSVLPYADEPLRLDPAISAWLLGDSGALLDDPRIARAIRPMPWVGAHWMRPDDLEQVRTLAQRLSHGGNVGEYTLLAGEDADGWRALIEAASEASGMTLVRVTLSSLANIDASDGPEFVARLVRTVRVQGAACILDAADSGSESLQPSLLARLLSALGAAGVPGVLIAPDAQRAVEALPRAAGCLLLRDQPDNTTVAKICTAAAAAAGLRLEGEESERLAMAFPLTLTAVENAVRLAALEGASKAPPEKHYSLLAAAFRRVASPALPRFARRIEPIFRLDDVVLPPDRRAQLDEMVAHVVHSSKVLNGWGFRAQLPFGRGIAALFCGPSGTGKTMAAQAIARELQTETYVVDLSRVVSKYIGESEKNLDAVFNDAERAGAVLLFDEADALFGKRSEVKDAHDRYANLEVAYLLQRMEAFSGLAILTTNFRQNLDHAFLRRLRFVVEFPKPDGRAREAIWRQCLPETAPLGGDVDIRFFARQLEITGGTIRLITVRAAFAAAREGSDVIEMRHVVAAARLELLKLGMPAAERELTEVDEAQRRIAARVA